MRKLLNVLVLMLALNFLAVAGAVAWLHQTGRIDRSKIAAIREIVFPPPALVQGEAALQAEPDPTTQPVLQLEELLSRYTGLPPGRQVEFIQQSFDAQMAILDRRRSELDAMQRQVELAKQQVEIDRAALSEEQAALVAREEQAALLASDKGFQDSLALYGSMPGKQVKAVFMTLEDPTVMRYLQAMEPRMAARIVREFKTPDEVARIQRVLEMMRRAEQPADPQAAPERSQQQQQQASTEG